MTKEEFAKEYGQNWEVCFPTLAKGLAKNPEAEIVLERCESIVRTDEGGRSALRKKVDIIGYCGEAREWLHEGEGDGELIALEPIA